MKLSNKLIALLILLMSLTLASCSDDDDDKDEDEVIVNAMTATINITTSSSTVTETVTFDASDNIAIDGTKISGTSSSYTIEVHTDDGEVKLFAESSSITLAEGETVDNSDEHEYTGTFTFSNTITSEDGFMVYTCENGVYTLGK
jgi:uncharacterized protein YcfL